MRAPTPEEIKAMEAKARPLATAHAMQIVAAANNSPDFPQQAGTYAGLLASLTAQTVFITIATHVAPAGSKEGEELLEQMYAAALRDAKERWHKADIRGMGPGEGKH